MSHPLALRAGLLAGAIAVGGMLAGAAIWPAATWQDVLLVAAVALTACLLGVVVFRGPGLVLKEISSAAARIVAGQPEARAARTASGTAAASYRFNVMADQLQSRIATAKAEQARLMAVVETSSEGIIAVDRNTVIRLANAAALHLLREPPEGVLQRPLIEACRDYEINELVQRVAAERLPATAVISFGPDRISLHAAAAPIPGGGDWSVLLVLTSLEEFERLDRIRRDFVSNVSHELRTPLTSIKALVETLEADTEMDRATASQFLARIRSQVDRLAALVSDLLDLSRIESGALSLEPVPIRAREVLEEAAATLRLRASRAGISILVDSAVERDVVIDPSVLTHIVTNLLDNAVKFSPAGSTVRVAASLSDGTLEVSVADEGPGIDPADLSRVFERFYKAGPSRHGESTGLGLAIVKHLAQVHGGSVSAKSQLGKGTTFTVTLREPEVATGARQLTPR